MDEQTKLMQDEFETEKQAIGLGQARYLNLQLKAGEKTPPGFELMRKMVPPTAAAVTAWITEVLSGKPTTGAGIGKFLTQFDATDAAFITCRAVLRSISGSAPATGLSMEITRELEQASMSAALYEADPKAFKRLITKAEKCRLPNKRYVLVRKAMEKAKVERINWTRAHRAQCGRLLLELCATATGMFTIEMVTSGERTLFVLRAEEATQTWLDQAHQRCAVQAPQYLPMVVPPRAWTNPFNGGYLDRKGLPLRMLTGRRINRNYLEELRTRPMPMVYEALNAVQATPWRINTRVLDVLRTLWDAGSSAAGLPSRDPLPIPVAPWGEGLEAPNEDAHKDHMAARGRAYEANYAMISRRRSLQAKLWVAEEFQQYEAIYFPHVLDWRGRLYPVPTHVNPQADDTGRAVLEFANGAPLGETGGFWLAVHGANCFGVDKVTFQARADWVQENQAQIVACAADPLASTWWHDAEDPFLFLAFVFEWADFVKHVSSGATQADFVSSIPVSWDGSCNGLQNFSAMLRDPIGGAATNLVPSSTPADIYQAVADVASAQVERDAVQGEVNAVYWRGKVTRKLAKRPTMTLPYGSGRYGFRDQIREELTKLKLANNKPYIEGDEFLCSLYLANVLHEALGKVVVAAVHAMDWLREASQVAAKQGLPVWWSTPAGFLAQQEYRDTIGQMVNLTLNGRRIRMTLEVEGTKLDARKQAQGISPNFVHSLDAAHLMRTVAKAHALGLRSFAMVHDSYGTHAGNAGLLHGVLREAFVEQYSTDVLTTFRDELIQQLPEEKRSEVPPVPTLGTLDLNDVLKSDYFFA